MKKGGQPSVVNRSLGAELDGVYRRTLMMGSRIAPELGQYAAQQAGCCSSEDVATETVMVWADNSLRGKLPTIQSGEGPEQGLEVSK